MVSLALEIQESVLDEVQPTVWSSAKQLNYSFFDHLTFGYSYIGLMTGPFYKYQTFQDMLYQNGVSLKTMKKALLNLKPLTILVVPYLVLKSKFPLEYFESEEFLNNDVGFLYTTFTMTMTVWWFRWRYYIGWLLAKSLCIAAGLGCYPDVSHPKPGKGPTESTNPEKLSDKQTEVKESKYEIFSSVYKELVLFFYFLLTVNPFFLSFVTL